MSCSSSIAGGYPIEALPNGWMTAHVTLQHRNGREETRIEIIDLKTMNRYLHEPMRTTAIKCIALFLFTGVYLAAYVGFHLLRTIVCSLCEFWKGGRAAHFFKKGIWNIVRAPFYAIGIELAALYGIVKPLEGRKRVADLESLWHQKGRQNDLAFADLNLSLGSLCWGAFADSEFSYTYFLAFCMQPHGKTTDPHIIAVKEISCLHLD